MSSVLMVKVLSTKVTQATSGLMFPASMWLTSRVLIWVAMLVVAPMLPAPNKGVAATFGLSVFSAWDSLQYEKITTSGYEYGNGSGNVVFFPLYPLILRVLISSGLSFEVAGLLVSNLAFLIFLYLLYIWLHKYQGEKVARWAVAVAAWFPSSIFTAVIYTEALYLLLSTTAMKAFDQNKYTQTAIFGALATATRPTGIALIPAFILAAWQQKKSFKAYIAGLATSTGVVCFSIYCAVQYGDPLAFIHAQKAWRPNLGFDWQLWWKMLMQITVGIRNYKHGGIKDITHPLIFLIIMACCYLLWRYRNKLSAAKVDYGFGVLFLGLWLLAGDPLINTSVFVVSTFLIWHFRRELTPVTIFYGLCGLGLLFFSGGTISLSRLVYGIVPTIIAYGILLARYPRWGYMSIGFFTILLFTFSLRIAQKLWVG
jgi:Gpi18-like mannosyltransferase